MSRPSSILPIPRTVALTAGTRRWPKRFEVDCRTEAARPVADDFGKLSGGGEGAIRLTLRASDSPLSAQGYTLLLETDAVQGQANDIAGFRHALTTLEQLLSEPYMPIGRIDDAPAMKLRGFHLNFESYRRMDFDTALRFIETAARFKLNALLVEYGPRFPLEAYPDLRDPAALTLQQIARLNEAAAASGIRLIPLQQSLAHLEYVLRHERFAHLRERPPKFNLLCPMHDESLPLIKSLAAEVMAAHPCGDSAFFHLGGDEARKIGECPRCRPLVEKEGVGAVYGRYMGQLARWVMEQGRRPIIWDDVVCAHPEALEHLPRETIIQYWDYIAVADPTPVLIPRMSHAQGGPRVAHDWSWSVPGRRKKLPTVVQDVMRNYSKPSRLRASLGDDFLKQYGTYLGPGFPKLIRALPYLEYYQDRGFDVITSPTGMGNGDTEDGTPNFDRFEANIRTHAQRCNRNGRALGILTTAWYDVPPELLYQPLVRTAMCGWTGR